MKRYLFIFTLLAVLAMCAVPAAAADGVGAEDYLYSDSGGNITLTKYFGEDESEIIIPAEIDGMPVTKIGEKCFEDHEEIERVILPDTLKVIDYRAFYGCSNLTDMNMPETLEKTGGWVFAHTGFESFTFPEGFTSLGYGTFYGSDNLKTVILPEGVTSIGENTFRMCPKLESVTIPSAEIEINIKGFQEKSKVTIIGVPGSYAEKYAKAIEIGFEAYEKPVETAVTESTADGWICPGCGKEAEGNFCPYCGTKKPAEGIICTECGESYPADAGYAFCPNCGAALPKPESTPAPTPAAAVTPEPTPEPTPESEPTPTPEPEATDNEAIPEELVGDWEGVGKPKNGGSPIDLTIHVEDDGRGEYTFDQAGYHESYPFTISRDGNRFSVDIPATSQLGSVEGTWELKNEILVLDITSTFTRGGSYSYIAECKKAAAKETDIKETDSRQGIAAEYNWLTYRLTVDSAEIVPGTELDKSPFSTIKDKSFAKIRLLGKNGSIQLTDLQEDSQLEQFVLTNKDGKELPLYSVSMWGVGFDAEKGTFSTFEKQEGFDLIFLLDGSEAVEDLTLTVRN